MRSVFGVTSKRDRLGNYEPQRAIYPGYESPVVRLDDDGNRELVMGKWGFIYRPKSKKTGKLLAPKPVNNARDDKLGQRFWNASFRERRCLVPASSFCEAKGRAPATYFWFGLDGEGDERPPFAFAGFWRSWKGEWRSTEFDGFTHTVVTSTPNELVKPVHPSRMVVILAPEDYETWLHGSEDDAMALCRPFPAEEMRVIKSGQDEKSDG